MLAALLTISLCPGPQDSTSVMDSVYLFSSPTHVSHEGSRLIHLTEGVSLSDRLSFSPYFTKEYGPSGIRTLGLRGSQASQTQVIWHGIPINNPMLGETDLQTLNISSNDNLSLNQSANASVYGSGAVGGALIIHNKPSFTQGFKQTFDLSAGNFGFSRIATETAYSNKNFNVSFGLNKNHIENNYAVVINEEKVKLKHAQTDGLNLNLKAALKLGKSSLIKTVAEWNHSNRNLPNFFSNQSIDELEIESRRWMMEGFFGSKRVKHGFNLGYIQEFYEFTSLASPKGSRSNTNLLVARYWWKLHFYKFFNIELISEMQHQNGQAASYAGTKEQFLPAAVVLTKYKRKNISLGLQNRLDLDAMVLINKAFFDIKHKSLRVYGNAGNAFRRPTLNQLYWDSPVARNLNVEEGIFAEIGVAKSHGSFVFDFSSFGRSMKNEITWIPNGSSSEPVNLNRTRAAGLSSAVTYKVRIAKVPITFSKAYEYVLAKTFNNGAEAWQNTLFVPNHSCVLSIKADLKKIHLGLRNRLTSFRYSSYSNEDYVDGFSIWSAYAHYMHKNFTFRINANNLLNAVYYVQPGQQMPTRQYQLGINYRL